MPTTDPAGIIRKKPRKKGEYHGYGPEGYKPSPYAKARTNLDIVADVKRTLDERSGKLPPRTKRFGASG